MKVLNETQQMAMDFDFWSFKWYNLCLPMQQTPIAGYLEV